MGSFELLPAIDRDLLFIKSTNNDLITFAKEIRLAGKLPVDDFSTYIFMDAGSSDMYSDKLGSNSSFDFIRCSNVWLKSYTEIQTFWRTRWPRAFRSHSRIDRNPT